MLFILFLDFFFLVRTGVWLEFAGGRRAEAFAQNMIARLSTRLRESLSFVPPCLHSAALKDERSGVMLRHPGRSLRQCVALFASTAYLSQSLEVASQRPWHLVFLLVVVGPQHGAEKLKPRRDVYQE